VKRVGKINIEARGQKNHSRVSGYTTTQTIVIVVVTLLALLALWRLTDMHRNSSNSAHSGTVTQQFPSGNLSFQYNSAIWSASGDLGSDDKNCGSSEQFNLSQNSYTLYISQPGLCPDEDAINVCTAPTTSDCVQQSQTIKSIKVTSSQQGYVAAVRYSQDGGKNWLYFLDLSDKSNCAASGNDIGKCGSLAFKQADGKQNVIKMEGYYNTNQYFDNGTYVANPKTSVTIGSLADYTKLPEVQDGVKVLETVHQ
jgi:hypothetical protein